MRSLPELWIYPLKLGVSLFWGLSLSLSQRTMLDDYSLRALFIFRRIYLKNIAHRESRTSNTSLGWTQVTEPSIRPYEQLTNSSEK
uniref:Uncharacterized protein n=1 Tax=Arundo donax TaxID=35708 RepID=A0A0A9GKQ7_ARUDO